MKVLATTRCVSNIAVPTARSTPAVRMISVWPTASVASTAVWLSIVPMFSVLWNAPLPRIVNTMHDSTSTNAGLIVG